MARTARKAAPFLVLALSIALLWGCRQAGPPQEGAAAKPESPLAECSEPERNEPPEQSPPQLDQEEPSSEANDLLGNPNFSFSDLPDALYFSSGAGAWRTELRVEADGSFSADYSDMDMGDAGEIIPTEPNTSAALPANSLR